MAPGSTGRASADSRDATLFLSHVKEFFGGASHPEPDGVPDSIYPAEGDGACQWLAKRPAVSGRSPDQGAFMLFRRFLREAEPVDDWPCDRGALSVRGSVVYDAWNYLCPDLADTRIWIAPPGSD